MKKVLDANIVVRYLVSDDTEKAERFSQLLKETGYSFILTDVSVAEIVWVLESYYRVSRPDIVDKLHALLAVNSIISNKEILGRALEYYKGYSVDYIDAYLASYAQNVGHLEIVSYDRDLDKLPQTKRLEP